MMMMMNKEELKLKIEKDLKYDVGGTIVCLVIVLVTLLFYFNLTVLSSFVIMALVFYNSYLITKREKQILEVLG